MKRFFIPGAISLGLLMSGAWAGAECLISWHIPQTTTRFTATDGISTCSGAQDIAGNELIIYCNSNQIASINTTIPLASYIVQFSDIAIIVSNQGNGLPGHVTWQYQIGTHTPVSGTI